MTVATEEQTEQETKTEEATPTLLYSRKNFDGCVTLRDYIEAPEGGIFRNVVGKVSIYKDTELVGFRVTGQESNWAAVIEGPNNIVVILGCQIRAVTSFQKVEGGQSVRPDHFDNSSYIVP